MKNLTLLTATVLMSLISHAKVSDFNSLIVENTQAQSELHQNLRQDLETTRMAYKKETRETNYIAETDSEASINVPTSKALLTFQKEKKYYRASEALQQKRLAQEMSEAE